MTPFLRFFYRILQALVRFSLSIFYPNSKILNRERLHFDYPAIMAGNHPNTLMDPLNAVGFSSRQAFFLANSGLFGTPFTNWLFSTFYCIPIERPKDVSGRRIQNEASFQKSYDHLAKGGLIFIAPEAYSLRERRVRPLKTGAARILLAAESQNEFALNSHILPVGVNYEHPSICGSRVLIRVGEPIAATDFATLYQQDQRKAVRAMTQKLQEAMESLVLQTRDDEEDHVLRVLQAIAQNDEPMNVAKHHFRSQKLLASIEAFRDKDETAFAKYKDKTDQYCQALKKNKLADVHLNKHFRWVDIPMMILGGIPALLGWINHLLPLGIPYRIERMMGIDKSYRATVKYSIGFFSFPLLYILQTYLVSVLTPPPWAWLYLVSLPLSGLYTRWYWAWAKAKWAGLYFSLWKMQHREVASVLLEKRKFLFELGNWDQASGFSQAK